MAARRPSNIIRRAAKAPYLAGRVTSNVRPHQNRVVPLRVAILLSLACATTVALSDSWRFPAGVREETFVHGKVRAVVTADARRNRHFPDFRLEVFKSGRRVAILPGVAVEQVFASPDNTLFVGLSNTGIPGTAVVVFSADGEVRLLATHQLATFDYCQHSTTLLREWYDSSNPSVRFVFDGPASSQGIYLRSCRGQEVQLTRTVQEAFARSLVPR